MKQLLPILTLLCCLWCSTVVYGQWEAKAPGLEQPLNIWDLDAVDENVVWAVTTDGVYSGNVWSINTSNTFIRTVDGGENWTVSDLPVPNSDWGIWKISAIDANTAWVAATNPFTLGSAIYKTCDGGDSWVKQDVFSNNSFCTIVHFWDENQGLAIGDPVGNAFEIYYTLDGGENWLPVDQTNIPTPISNQEYVSTSVCDIVGDHVRFGTFKSRVFHSPDRGQTWTASLTPINTITSNTWVEGITFKTPLEGIAYSARYNSPPYQHLIAYTEDGGENWISQPVANSDFALFKAQYIAGTDLLLKTSRVSNGLGPFSTSYSTDNGISWTDIETTAPIADFEFLDGSTAWGGKFKNNDDPTVLYRYEGDALTSVLGPQTLELPFTVYPNPIRSMASVELRTAHSMDLSLELYSHCGQLLLRRDLGEGAWFKEKIRFDLFPSGIYTLVL